LNGILNLKLTLLAVGNFIDLMLISMAVVSVISVGLLFLPAIIDLKKPHHSGPRLINDLFEQRFSSAKKLWSTSKKYPNRIYIGH